MIAAPIGHDDEVCLQARRKGLDQYMNLLGASGAAGGVATTQRTVSPAETELKVSPGSSAISLTCSGAA